RMLRLDIQQNELADKLGLQPGAISNWITGRNMPKGKSLRKLAAELHCEGWWLRVGGTSVKGAPGPAGAGTPQDEIRRKAKAYVDKLLDACRGDLEKMTWTYVEFQQRFPVGGRKPSSYKVSEEHKKAIAAA